jgi:hypothetical protein
MPLNDLRRFADWCLKSRELIGLTVNHPAFGTLRIESVGFDGITLVPAVAGTPDPGNADAATTGLKLATTSLLARETWLWFSRGDRDDLFQSWRAWERGDSLKTPAERRRAMLVRDIQDIFEEALCDELLSRIHVRSPAPSETDYLIAREWAGGFPGVPYSTKMLSARLAERAAAKFYEASGRRVVDVSITQIDRDAAGGEWRSYDLLVDGEPVDVKNARTSRKHPDRYVSHCVPAFKTDRHGAAVRIAGVLSPWTPDPRTLAGTSLTILGETSQQEFSSLQFDANATPSRFQVEGSLTSAKFLPPWIFNYPDESYPRRTGALKTFETFGDAKWIAWADNGFNVRPALIFSDRSDLLTGLDVSLPSQRLAGMLAELHESGRLSVTRIFVALLQHFIACLRGGDPFDAAECRSLLFWNNHFDRPAFLLDPLKTIARLISNLGTIASRAGDDVQTFTAFRLSGLNLFQGKRPKDTGWSTLIAYCGGVTNGHRCAKVPLVIGEHALCSCKRLICDDCGYCSPGCDERRFRSPRFTLLY